ncbi:hypothetical protein [Sulfoacidibacillus thermotolerans]|uniref:Uncharacterized protein n=1 Tax=Sulfoacidibacillus thermotolerans TaxID=1765684 RepID=A0A2U3DA97_SULT2|nr:hypothetical protein [Sulfoacidibacillus thermotolerans]PWI58209.1 hypothetical protein BM613_04560 [Sulfoacidibacillus thermotolerans]
MNTRALFATGIGVGLLLAAGFIQISPRPAPEAVDSGLVQQLQVRLQQVSAHATQLQRDLQTTQNKLQVLEMQAQHKVQTAVNKSVTHGVAVDVNILSGMTIDQIATLLQNKGVLTTPKLFIQLAEHEPYIHAGHYVLYKNEAIAQILVALTSS